MNFQEYIDRGLIRSRKHPEKDWFLLSYSQDAVLGHIWEPEVRSARSLVVDSDFNVVSPCIPKFFNDFQEAKELHEDGFEAYEKLDGSLIYLFLDDEGELHVRSSSMWTSDVALKAKEFAQSIDIQKYMAEGHTYMCEWIHPLNRHVVDYGKKIALILLCVIEHGDNRPDGSFQHAPEEVNWFANNRAKKIDLSPDSAQNLKLGVPRGEEGYILWNRDTNIRTKIKSPEYLELHRVRFNMNPKAVFGIIESGNQQAFEDMRKILTELDEQSEKMILDIYYGMVKEIEDYVEEVQKVYERVKDIEKRGDLARSIQSESKIIQAGVFSLADDRGLDKIKYRVVNLQKWNEWVDAQGIIGPS